MTAPLENPWGLGPEEQARSRQTLGIMANPEFSELHKQASLYQAYQTERDESTMSSLGNFAANTAFAAGPGLIGFDPPEGLDRWSQRHPILGMVSEMIGTLPSFMVPYIGQSMLGLKLMQGTKLGMKAVEAASLAKSPFLQGAALEALKWTPLEVGKLTASVLASPFGASPYNVAKQVGIELPLMATFGGGKTWLASRKGTPTPDLSRMEGVALATNEVRIAQITPGYDLKGTPQDKFKAIQVSLDAAPEGKSPLKETLEELRDHYDFVIRWEEAGKARLPGMGPDDYVRTGYGRHVQKVISKGGADTYKRATDRINSLYESVGGVEAKKFVVGTGGFKTADELALAEVGIGEFFPQHWQGIAQFPRQLFFSPKGALKLEKILKEDMQRAYAGINRDLWLAQEAGKDGLYFGIGRVQVAKKGAPLWKYYMFKTSNPAKFAPGVDSLLEVQLANFVHSVRGALPGVPQTEEDAVRLAKAYAASKVKVPDELGGGLWDPANPEHITNLMARSKPHPGITPTLFDAEEFYKIIGPGRAGLVMTAPEREIASAGLQESKYAWVRYLDSFLSKQSREAREEAVRIVGEHGFMLKNALAPAMSEFTRSPLAVSMWAFTRHVGDGATRRAVHQLVGAPKSLEGKNMVGHFAKLRSMDRELGLIQRVEPAFTTEQGTQQFWRSWLETLSPDEARARGFRSEVVKALEALEKVDNKNIAEWQAQRVALGMQDTFEPMSWHYMMSRTWVGHYRVPLRDATTGHVEGYASGWNSGGALKEAREIVARVNKKSVDENSAFRLEEIPLDQQALEKAGLKALHDWDPGLSRLQQDLYMAAEEIPTLGPLGKKILKERADLIMEDPVRMQHRMGHYGFAGEAKPLTWKDAKNKITANIMETHKVLARDATWGFIQNDLRQLALEDAALAKRFIQRWNSMQGIAGDKARAIEKGIDKVFSALFGAQSGSRMAAAFNEATFFLTLGALDAGFVALNAMTPIQTVLPELAFLLSAPPQRLMGYYGFQLIKTPAGLKAMGYLDPMRILTKAFKNMAKPDAELAEDLRWAVDGGVMARQFVETAVGQDSKILRELAKGKIFSKDDSAFRNILNAMQSPVAASEEFSRGLSFIAGRMVGKDFFGLQDKALRTFASDFALRTNYGYRTFDRARAITGALGTGWGLFKNWTWHYTTNLLGAYSKEALHGNFRPLLWAGLGTGSVAGAMGIPGYGIANSFSKTFTDQSLSEHVYNMMGHSDLGIAASDGFLYGAPSIFNVSLQGRASAPGAEVMRDTQMFLNTVHLQRAIGLGNTLGHGFDLARRGINPYDSHNFNRSLIQTFAPRTIQRAYAATAKDGLISMQTGNRIMPDPSMVNTALYSLGIVPLDIEKRYSAHNELYEKTSNMQERIQFYGDLLAQATMAGARVPFAEVVNRTMYEDVPLDSVLRSMKSRLGKENSDLINRRWDVKTRWGIMQSRGLF